MRTTMNHRTNRAIAVFLVLSHLLAFGLHSVFHSDLILFSGSLEQQVFPHEDTDRCKHIPISEHCYCPICISHHNRIAPEQYTFDNGQLQIVDEIEIGPTVLLPQIHLFGSLSQRGPPSVIL